MEDITKLLKEEIKSEIEKLSSLESGSEEKSKAIDDLVKLYKLKIEETKNQLDYSDKFESRECDDQIKREQLNELIKDRYFRVGIAAAEIMLPLMFYGLWMRSGLKFEETGTYTSTTFRGLINCFKPKKK